VVCRPEDEETRQMLEAQTQHSLPLLIVPVSTSGVVAALNVGLSHATMEIIAITDDDAAPHPDWLERIATHFQRDSLLAGVGGRDQVFVGDIPVVGEAHRVGLVQWWGRTIGGHHLGCGAMREVDVLKGVNMAFRRSLIEGVQFDSRLLGVGAQVNNELGFCLALRRLNRRIIYDPAVLVDHFESLRWDEERVSTFRCDNISVYNASYNEGLILVEHLAQMPCGALRVVTYLLWSLAIGTRKAPGLLQAIRFTPRHHVHAWRRFFVTQRAKTRAAYDARR
jgi:glycosyltransferase involved in cell wall biosynthesis